MKRTFESRGLHVVSKERGGKIERRLLELEARLGHLESEKKTLLYLGYELMTKMTKNKQAHSFRVAKRAVKISRDITLMVTALLHDLQEQKPNLYKKKKAELPKAMQKMVDALSVPKAAGLSSIKGENVPLKHLQDVFPLLTQEQRNALIIIKLCDRLDNLKKRIREKKLSKKYRHKSKELFKFLAQEFVPTETMDYTELISLGDAFAAIAKSKNYFVAEPLQTKRAI